MDFLTWAATSVTFSPEHRVELFFKSGGTGYFRTPYWGHFKDIVSTVGKWRERTKVWEVDKMGIVYVLQAMRAKRMLDRTQMIALNTKDSFWLPEAELGGTIIWTRDSLHSQFSRACWELFMPIRSELVNVEFVGYSGLLPELENYFGQVDVTPHTYSAIPLVTDAPADEVYLFMEFLAGYGLAGEVVIPLNLMNGNIIGQLVSMPMIPLADVVENNVRRDSSVRRLR